VNELKAHFNYLNSKIFIFTKLSIDTRTLKRYNNHNKSDDRKQVNHDLSFRELSVGARQQESFD